jgi:hypothetical protein
MVLAVLFNLYNFRRGEYLESPALVLIPVVLATWHRGLKWGIPFGVLMPGIRFALYCYHGLPVSMPVALFTLFNRCLVIVLVVYLIHRIATQNRELARKVNVLEGILPICGFCKKIRDSEDRWQPLEKYISAKSEAQFSHCCCPECMRKHYGEELANEALKPSTPGNEESPQEFTARS